MQSKSDPPNRTAQDLEQPLQKIRTAAFSQLLEIESDNSAADRVLNHFLGVERPSRHGTSLGLLRCALAWQLFPTFLKREGWEIEGSFGLDPRRDEIGMSAFKRLNLSENLHLEVPLNLSLFLARAEGRAVLRFEEFETPGASTIRIQTSFSCEPSDLLDRWMKVAGEENLLRGRSLLPSGKVLERRGLLEEQVLFVAGETRRRIDFAAQRFLSPEAARLSQFGVRARAGLILAGAPGNGKTSLCRELSSRLDCSFLWVTPGDFSQLQDVAEIYELARWLAPTVVVLEDLDLIAESRDRGNQSRLLGELMNQLDGVGGDHRVLTIATTNRLEVVEEAMRNRPGRFDQVIEVESPTSDLRASYFEHRFRQCAIEPSDVRYLVSKLDGATGAELEEIANVAIALALFEGGPAAPRPLLRRSQIQLALADLGRRPERSTAGFGADAAAPRWSGPGSAAASS